MDQEANAEDSANWTDGATGSVASSSVGSPPPAVIPTWPESPRVTVSFCGKDDDVSVPPGQRQFEHSQAAGGSELFADLNSDDAPAAPRDVVVRWPLDPADGVSWGTRRRSLPSTMHPELESGISGNILKKLAINNKPDNPLKGLRHSVLQPSISLLKENQGGNDDDSRGSDSQGQDWRHESFPRPTPRRVPMASNFASIGATHTRSGSISATPVTSPKSPFGGLTVKNTLRRPRSKSALTKSSPGKLHTDHPSLVTMWRGAGGPPVANFATTTNNEVEDEDEDEDDDEFGDEGEMKGNANIINSITPDTTGFQQYILSLNPTLASTNNYLVERIAYQQVVRYKQLLRSKVIHLNRGATCPSGSLCIALGGSASILDPADKIPRPEQLLSSPVDGRITNKSFPRDIPMPPTTYLPAEFECQLCYQIKRIQKPSDWVKHIHEDVQPFTCTWDKCREPKIFKRKADWVRHENEGHRHLEWWTCDVEGCHHQCYRRDNFLQHLVREHKFQEPKVKTKAAMKRSGGGRPDLAEG